MMSLWRNKDFRRLLLGRLVTNVGDSLYLIGAMWLVYDLTGSSFFTGVAAFLIRVPTALQFLFGPLVDRWDLRRIFVSTQLVQGIVVLLIPIAALLNRLSVWIVLLVLPVLSFVNQLVSPAQYAALPRIVETDEEITRANSLLTTVYRGADAVFNAFGGAVLAVTSATILFVIDSATFIIAAALFAGIAIPAKHDDENDEAERDYLAEIRAGIDYVRGSLIFWMVASSMVGNLGYGAVLAILPAYADSLGGATTYGLLMAAIAGGTLVGSLSSSLVDDRRYGHISIVGFLLAGLALFLALILPGRLLTIGFIFVAAVPIGTYNVIFWSMIQSVVDNEFLGRAISLVQSIAVVMVPIGSLLGGAIAEVSAPESMLYTLAVLYVLQSVYFFVHPRLRSLPKIHEADESTLGLDSSTPE